MEPLIYDAVWFPRSFRHRHCDSGAFNLSTLAYEEEKRAWNLVAS
jgi:hypothetical protein